MDDSEDRRLSQSPRLPSIGDDRAAPPSASNRLSCQISGAKEGDRQILARRGGGDRRADGVTSPLWALPPAG